MKKERILVVDDEEDIRSLIITFLKREGYETVSAATGNEALVLIDRQHPDLIILDIMLPDIDGLEVCQQVRKSYAIPILLLSAKSEEFDKVLGLSLGGDDYLTKPFSPWELIARVKAILRRSRIVHQQGQYQVPAPTILTLGHMTIDVGGYRVQVNNQQIMLPGKEFELLAYLAQHVNQVFSKEQLYEKVWGSDAAGDSRTVMVHIRHLREKLSQYPEVADYIKTVWGVGYKFQPD